MSKKNYWIFLSLGISFLVSFYIIILKKEKNKISPRKEQKKANIEMPDKALSIRNSSFAGSFYPNDSSVLSKKIDNFLKEAQKIFTDSKIRILIVPHAGIEYSGRVAGWGFKQIENMDYKKIFLLGSSHRYLFNYAAIYPEGLWITPLGKTMIDEDTISKMLTTDKIITEQRIHDDEHSLELELIFLQSILKDFKIIPILISQIDEDLAFLLAQKIAENFDDNSLLVISSDFSHYPSYQVAVQVDKKTIESILSGKKELFENTIKNLMSQNLVNLDTCACGEEAIKIGLKVGEILGINDYKLLKYENSGDVTGEKERVVGYASIAGYSRMIKNVSENQLSILNENEQIQALKLARETLEKHFGLREELILPRSDSFNKHYGVFVTLRKNHQLRGCIGAFEPRIPLKQSIPEMAKEAAFNDPRFLPLSKNELKEIKIEISILTPLKRMYDWRQIQLGKHGVVIKKGLKSGTFLPQVAQETGWTKEKFLSELCTQKAGLPENCYMDPEAELYVFEAQIFEER